jgi:hypothetical protein
MKLWLKIVLACFVGVGILFGVLHVWSGVIFAVISAVAFIKAFGQKKEETMKVKDKK